MNAFIRTRNSDMALMALNYLLYLDNKEPFVESVKAVHKMPNRIYNVKAACVDVLGSLGLVSNDFNNRN